MQTIGDLHERNAAQFPDRVAWVCDGERRTYADFLSQARRLASAAERLGLERQDRIGIFAANSIACYETFAACELAAFIGAAFNFRSAAPELAYLIKDSEPALLVFDAAGTATVEAARTGADTVRRYICIGGETPPWATSYEDFLAEGDPSGPALRACASDYAYLFYTSGTTGRPKGVPSRHSAWLITAPQTKFTEEVNLLQISPPYHVGGRGPTLAAAWATGKVVLHRNFDATAFLEAVQSERINTAFMVPAMIQDVLEHPELERFDLSSLEWVMAASTAIPPAMLARAVERIGPVFYVAYGSTETGSVARLRRIETRADGPSEATARLASVGHVEPLMTVKLLDDAGAEVPDGAVGEICVRTHMFDGYWNNPEASASAMEGEFFRTGDMGRFDDRKYLFIVDRKKDIIISGGENIYSREVEDALHRHPAVAQAAVIGAPDPRWGEQVVAVVRLEPGADLTAEQLIAFSQGQIARFKCPKRIIMVGELPLNATGKIDKLALRAAYAAEDAASPTSAAAS